MRRIELMQHPTPGKTRQQAPRGKEWLRLSLLILLCLLLFAAIGLMYLDHQSDYFAPGTSVSGVDCGGWLPEQAEALLREAAVSREIRLSAEDGTPLGTATLAELTKDVDYASQLAAFHAQQRQQRGLLLLGECDTDFALDLTVPLDILEGTVEDIVCGGDYQPVEPQDARLVMDEEGVHIQSEDNGNLRNLSACTDAVAAYLEGDDAFAAKSPATLTIENALLGAEITADDPILKSEKFMLSRYTDMELTLNFCRDISYTLTPADILSVLDLEFTDRAVRITVNEERTAAFLDELIKELGVDGVDAKYGNVAPTREYVYYTVSDRGFLMDREALYADALFALKNHRGTTLTAVYDYDWWLKETYGYMGTLDTIIEISIANQYLWFYCDGQLLTETPVTTGCIANGSYTNTGAFRVSYLASDTYLNGPTWHYHVDYWIPFDGDIGLHDAYWQDHYGGDHYLTDGSHGCVNTPLEPMRIIFENSRWDTAVIVR